MLRNGIQVRLNKIEIVLRAISKWRNPRKGMKTMILQMALDEDLIILKDVQNNKPEK